jgi:hypothetical protein
VSNYIDKTFMNSRASLVNKRGRDTERGKKSGDERNKKKVSRRRQIKETDEMKAFIRAVESKLRFPTI